MLMLPLDTASVKNITKYMCVCSGVARIFFREAKFEVWETEAPEADDLMMIMYIILTMQITPVCRLLNNAVGLKALIALCTLKP